MQSVVKRPDSFENNRDVPVAQAVAESEPAKVDPAAAEGHKSGDTSSTTVSSQFFTADRSDELHFQNSFKRQRRNRTNAEKLSLVNRVLAAGEGISLTSVAKAAGVPESTLRGWVREREKLAADVPGMSAVFSRSRGGVSQPDCVGLTGTYVSHTDLMPTLTLKLLSWIDEKRLKEKGVRATTAPYVSASELSARALEVRRDILADGGLRDTLAEREANALARFTASLSWARKFKNVHGLPTNADAEFSSLGESVNRCEMLEEEVKADGEHFASISKQSSRSGLNDAVASTCDEPPSASPAPTGHVTIGINRLDMPSLHDTVRIPVSEQTTTTLHDILRKVDPTTGVLDVVRDGEDEPRFCVKAATNVGAVVDVDTEEGGNNGAALTFYFGRTRAKEMTLKALRDTFGLGQVLCLDLELVKCSPPDAPRIEFD